MQSLRAEAESVMQRELETAAFVRDASRDAESGKCRPLSPLPPPHVADTHARIHTHTHSHTLTHTHTYTHILTHAHMTHTHNTHSHTHHTHIFFIAVASRYLFSMLISLPLSLALTHPYTHTCMQRTNKHTKMCRSAHRIPRPQIRHGQSRSWWRPRHPLTLKRTRDSSGNWEAICLG